jgi:diguanylate cyclase (GGDEF)-like protein
MDKFKLKPILVFLTLTLLGLCGNVFKISLYFGVDFIFGSIALLIIAYLYGPIWSALVSIIINSYTFFLWQHYYGIILFTAEVIVVGILLRKKHKSFVLTDILFWVFIGSPLVYFLYHKCLGMDNIQVVTIILKDITNGVFNALIASIIVTWIPLKKWTFCLEEKTLPSIEKTTTELLLLIVLCTSLIMNTAYSRHEYDHRMADIKIKIESESNKASSIIRTWHNDHFYALNMLAQQISESDINSPSRLQQDIEIVKRSFPNFSTIYFADSQGKTIAFSPTTNVKGESTIGIDFSDREYFRKLRKTNRPVVSQIFMGRGGVFEPIITINIPVIIHGNFYGYISGSLDIDKIHSLLNENFNIKKTRVTIIDNNRKIISSNDKTSKPMQLLNTQKIDIDKESNEYYIHNPEGNNLPAMERWKNSFYAYEAYLGNQLPWTIITERPFLPQQQEIFLSYIKSFIVMFILIVIILIIGILLSRRLTNSIIKLAVLTTNLPIKFKDYEKLDWPDSKISEICSLIYNFKKMSYMINNNFKTIEDTNKTLEYMAKHDSLTNLPNRVLFKELLNERIGFASKNNKKLAAIYIDVDKFKRINDTFGHSEGDKVLIQIANRFEKCIKNPSTFFRIEGDEFILLLSDIDNKEEILTEIDRITYVIQQPYKLNRLEFQVTVSMGIALYPEDGEDVDTLLKHADMAMYHAKQLGRNNYKFYDSLIENKSLNKLYLEIGLTKALENNEFELYYQPKLGIKSGKMIGAEALIRWNSPEYGLVSPAKFIPIAEETGLILPIGEWVLSNVCKEIKSWKDKGNTIIPISINLSSIQIQKQDFINNVLKIIETTGIEAQWLEFEITESTIIQDIELAIDTIDKIKDIGANVSLDDFGIGFSSLNYIKNFKIDTLKIDASFIADIDKNSASTAIVKTIIGLGRNLNLKVVAEGVETKEQFEFLKKESCDEVQGYYYSKPLSIKEFEKLLIEG